MKRFIVSLVLVVFACTGASAESSVWKVQKGASVIYLGGSCHLLRETDFPLPPEFDKAYKASEVVVFETDIGKLLDPSLLEAFMSKARYPDGSTLEKHLNARTYGELRAYCDANGIPLDTLRQFKPSMLMVTLTVVELMKLGVTQHGVDQFFYGLANEDKKAVERLETIDEQFNYLLTMADGIEDEFVTYSLRDMKNVKQKYEDLVSAWRAGDAGKLDELMFAELKTRQPQIFRKLITDRNSNWLPLIEAYQKTPRTEFIVVGVGHLVGPDGIVEALKKKGYRVDRL